MFRPWAAAGLVMEGFFSIDGRLASPTWGPASTVAILGDNDTARAGGCDHGHGSRLSSQNIMGRRCGSPSGGSLVVCYGDGRTGVDHKKDREGQVFAVEGMRAPASRFGAGVGSGSSWRWAERRVQQHTAARVRRNTTRQQQQGGRWLTTGTQRHDDWVGGWLPRLLTKKGEASAMPPACAQSRSSLIRANFWGAQGVWRHLSSGLTAGSSCKVSASMLQCMRCAKAW